jgi:hypothetical protein
MKNGEFLTTKQAAIVFFVALVLAMLADNLQ